MYMKSHTLTLNNVPKVSNSPHYIMYSTHWKSQLLSTRSHVHLLKVMHSKLTVKRQTLEGSEVSYASSTEAQGSRFLCVDTQRRFPREIMETDTNREVLFTREEQKKLAITEHFIKKLMKLFFLPSMSFQSHLPLGDCEPSSSSKSRLR
jgi:hypothetical protein